MKSKRGVRWSLFVLAAACFVYAVFVDASVWAVCLFVVSGGWWYWLEQRKTRELDAPSPR